MERKTQRPWLRAILLASVFAGSSAMAQAQTLSYANVTNPLPAQALSVNDDGVTGGGGEMSSDDQTGVTGAAASPSPQDSRLDPPQASPVDASGTAGVPYATSGSEQQPMMPEASGASSAYRNALGQTMGNGPPLTIHPYIEAGQVAFAPITPAGEMLTYSYLAAGVNANINGNNNQGTIALNYEHQFGWGTQGDANVMSGMAQMGTAIIPGTLRLDYGAFATRTWINGFGDALAGGPTADGSMSEIWSVYAGPSLTTHLGLADVAAHYHVGLTGDGWPSDYFPATGNGVTGTPVSPDSFVNSLVQDAGASVGFAPGRIAPIGIGVEGGWYSENMSLLNQQIEDEHVRAALTVPVSSTLRLVGGVGYEHVLVSNSQALTDANGNPVIGANGLYVSNTALPDQIAFDISDIIWDVGVAWRPSPRTSLEAHYGHRYGSNGAWGTFSWRLDRRQSIYVEAHDDLVGFGGGLTAALVAAPSQFTTVSDPVSGTMGTCVATLQSGGCLAGALGLMNGLAYRDRDVMATWGLDLGRIQTGFGLGYDEHEYVVAPNSILGMFDNQTARYAWIATYLNDNLTRHSSLMGSLDVYRYQAGPLLGGDMVALHAAGTYSQNFTRHLTGSASLALDGVNLQTPDDAWIASGAFDLRYTF